MTLTSAQIRQVIVEDLNVLIGMTSVADLRKKNTANSFSTEDADAILRSIDAYADARVREHVARITAQATRRDPLRRSA